MLPLGFLTCVGIWLWVIFRILKHRSLDAFVPLCGRHRQYWLKRTLVVPIGIFASLGVLILGTFAIDEGGTSIATMLVSFGLLVGSFVVAGVLLDRGTRVKIIANDRITFEDVSPAFAEAVEKGQRDYEEKRKQWLHRRNSDERE